MHRGRLPVEDRFQKELEKYDACLIELMKLERGVYAFKMETPLATYLDSGTIEDIIATAMRDYRAYKNAKCATP